MSKKLISPNALHAFRCWERGILPHYGKEAGYLLLLELAKSGSVSSEMLKKFYISMPYAESTIRLLFRNLESDGWIEMPKKGEDKRVRQFILTENFQRLRNEWLQAATDILTPDSQGCTPDATCQFSLSDPKSS